MPSISFLPTSGERQSKLFLCFSSVSHRASVLDQCMLINATTHGVLPS